MANNTGSMLSAETRARLFDETVPVKETGGRWYVQFGYAGFNSPANNGRGYSSEALALAAIRRYDPQMRRLDPEAYGRTTAIVRVRQ